MLSAPEKCRHEQIDEEVARQPGPAPQKQQPAGGHRQGNADEGLPADVGQGDDPEVSEDQQGEAGGKQGEAPAQQQGQAGEAEKVDLEPLVQPGPQGPQRYQHDGAAEAKMLIERVGAKSAQQGGVQTEGEQHQPEQEGGNLSFTHERFPRMRLSVMAPWRTPAQ